MSATEELTRLAELERLVMLAGPIRMGAEFADALKRAGEEVAKAATFPQRLERIGAVLDAIAGAVPVQEVSGELSALSKAGRDLENAVDTTSLRDARFPIQDAGNALSNLERIAVRVWDASVEANFAPFRQLGALLGAIGETREAGQKIRNWADAVLACTKTGVPRPEQVQRVLDARSEIPAHLAALQELGIDAAVRDFLTAVIHRRATLEHLSAGVLDWIHRLGAGGRFNVIFT